jgi:formylglycine-generating enzyme required for sulfatase activity
MSETSGKVWTALRRYGFGGYLVIAMVLGAGCSFDASSGKASTCSEEFACPRGDRCVDGICVPEDGPSPDVDGGGLDADTGGAAGDSGPTQPDADPSEDAREDGDTLTDADPSDADPSDADPSDADPSDVDPSDVDTGGADADAGRADAEDQDVFDADAPDADTDTDPGGCTDGATRSCGISTGECELGMQTCQSGTWGPCQGNVEPEAEVCDGRDNDCDGAIDNDPVGEGDGCDTGLQGVCGQGAQVCKSGQLECEQVNTASPETCNGLDDDCNGQVDDDPAQVGQPCQTGEPGVCSDGEYACNSGQLACERLVEPSQEICDGLDNNCDGAIDEDFPDKGNACDTGLAGQCADGALACDGGAIECESINGPTGEVCDGVDNDCNGLVDDAADGRVLTQTCGGASCPGLGVQHCIDGQWSACQEGHEICDGSDTNCDTVVDNQTPCYRACPGGGAAVGTLDCSGATPVCELPAEICGDGVDNDCDGVVDNGCPNGNGLDDMLFVPGGPFWMGSQNNSWGAQQDETPIHLVELDPFYIDRLEVTRGEYRACWSDGVCSLPNWGCPYQGSGSTSDRLIKPIGCLTHAQAQTYCNWAGKRLPTAAEWEKTARGPYPRQVLFPWGNNANTANAVTGCSSGLNDCTVVVDSYPQGASYYGALHMAGNVGEWVSDYYDPDFYTANYTINPEQTSDQGYGRALRGGNYEQTIRYSRVSNRAILSYVPEDAMGIRCAMDAP